MSTMREYIEDNLKRKANKFSDAKEAKSSVGSEKRNTDEYEGRQLFELLQNADDEIIDNCDESIKIVFKNNILEIYNNGRPFSREGVDSLMYQDMSPKSKNNLEEIGCKGLGFRSILSWADKIMIDSDELHIKFSDEIAQKQLKKYMGNKYIKSLKASILEFPEWNENNKKNNYTTRISIKIKNNKRIKQDINEQINTLDGELLLFLNHAKKLEIDTDDYNREYIIEHEKKDNNLITLIEKRNRVIYSKEKWILLSEIGEGIDERKRKKYRVSIAYKENGKKPSKQVVYSYFPTKIKLNYPFLVHATFELNLNRNNLIKKEINKTITKTIVKLMVKLAVQISKNKFGYEALWLLLSNWDFPQDLIDCKIEEELITEIIKSKLFPNINGKYVSAREKLLYDDFNLGKYVKGDDFDNLIMNCEGELSKDKQYSLLKNRLLKLGIFKEFEKKDLISNINSYVANIKLNAEGKKIISFIAVALYKICFYRKDEIDSAKFLLIINNDNKILNCDRVSYIRDDKNLSNPPDFLKYGFIDNEYYDFLIDSIDEANVDIDEILKWLNIKHSNLDTILDSINEQIEKLIENEKNEIASNYSDLLIKWLWENKRLLDNNMKVNVYVKTREGSLNKSSLLYYGKEYGNELIERLLSEVEEDTFIVDIKGKLGIDDGKNKEVVKFLKKLGLNEYPRKIGESYSFCYFDKNEEPIKKEYCKELIKPIPVPYSNARSAHKFETKESMLKAVTFNIPFTDIEYLLNILKNIDTKYIMQWINKDKELNDILFVDKEDKVVEKHQSDFDSNNDIDYGMRYGNLTYDVIESKLKKAKPYIRYVFENYKWIEIQGEKYSANDVILDSEYKTVLKPILASINVDEYIEKNDKNLARKYREIFLDLGVVDNVNKLPYDKIYDILCYLPEVDKKGKYAVTIYNALINGDKKYDSKQIGNFDSYNLFRSGKAKVYTQNNEYVPISEVYYLNSANEISKKIRNKYNLINLPPRKGADLVKNIFNVEKLEIKYKLQEEPVRHEYANEFANFFKTLKPYIYCYKIDSISDDRKIRSFCDLKVILCEKIQVNYSGKNIELDNYEYIHDSGTYYVKYPNNDSNYFAMNRKLSKTISDILCSFFDAFQEKDKYQILFQCVNDEDRKEIIFEENNDPDIFIRVRNKLSIIGSAKEQFYGNMIYISQENTTNYEKYIDKINFESLNDESNYQALVNCFNAAKVDFEDYNELRPEIEINVIPYLRKKVEEVKEGYRSAYNTKIFNELKGLDIDKKKQFEDRILLFNEIVIQPKNSARYIPEEDVYKTLALEKNNVVDLNKRYFNNREKWLKDKDRNVAEEILKQKEYKSLLYFGEYDYLNKVYNDEKIKNNVITNNHDNKGVYVRDVKHRIVSTIAIEKQQNRTKHRNRYSVQKNYDNNISIDSLAEETGRIGERIVYNVLSKEGLNVVWNSENAYKDGVDSQGHEGNGYDMYVDYGNYINYIEVKASKGNTISFEMTDNEYKTACENYKHYFIYFVANIDIDPTIYILKDLFTQDGFDNEKGNIITTTKYYINAKVK